MQAFGGVRGYISDCGDAQEWAVVDPCAQSGEDTPCNHEQVREDVQVRLLPAFVVPAHVPVLIAVLGEESIDALSVQCGQTSPRVEDVGPPLGVAVARTVVLLI